MLAFARTASTKCCHPRAPVPRRRGPPSTLPVYPYRGGEALLHTTPPLSSASRAAQVHAGQPLRNWSPPASGKHCRETRNYLLSRATILDGRAARAQCILKCNPFTRLMCSTDSQGGPHPAGQERARRGAGTPRRGAPATQHYRLCCPILPDRNPGKCRPSPAETMRTGKPDNTSPRWHTCAHRWKVLRYRARYLAA